MITGIGTPNSQSKRPRPIVVASMKITSHHERDIPHPVPPDADDDKLFCYHQCPVLGMDVHGSCGGSASPFCSSSMECRSGERTNAIWPSRGGRLMAMPSFLSRSRVA